MSVKRKSTSISINDKLESNSLTQHENSVPTMLSYRALTVYIILILIYAYIYMICRY